MEPSVRRPGLDASLAVRNAVTALAGLPRSAYGVVIAMELVGTLAAHLPQPVVAVLISIVVTAWARLAAPASVAIPLTFVDGTVVVLAQMGLAFAIYRQLFDRIVRSYPLSDEGRLAFEADSRALAMQGYGVVSQIDRETEREIAWSR